MLRSRRGLSKLWVLAGVVVVAIIAIVTDRMLVRPSQERSAKNADSAQKVATTQKRNAAKEQIQTLLGHMKDKRSSVIESEKYKDSILAIARDAQLSDYEFVGAEDLEKIIDLKRAEEMGNIVLAYEAKGDTAHAYAILARLPVATHVIDSIVAHTADSITAERIAAEKAAAAKKKPRQAATRTPLQGNIGKAEAKALADRRVPVSKAQAEAKTTSTAVPASGKGTCYPAGSCPL